MLAPTLSRVMVSVHAYFYLGYYRNTPTANIFLDPGYKIRLSECKYPVWLERKKSKEAKQSIGPYSQADCHARVLVRTPLLTSRMGVMISALAAHEGRETLSLWGPCPHLRGRVLVVERILLWFQAY